VGEEFGGGAGLSVLPLRLVLRQDQVLHGLVPKMSFMIDF
jgi:hypothetical protein